MTARVAHAELPLDDGSEAFDCPDTGVEVVQSGRVPESRGNPRQRLAIQYAWSPPHGCRERSHPVVHPKIDCQLSHINDGKPLAKLAFDNGLQCWSNQNTVFSPAKTKLESLRPAGLAALFHERAAALPV